MKKNENSGSRSQRGGKSRRREPGRWSRSELSTAGKEDEEAVLQVYGKRGGQGFVISELSKHGPGTENFRVVLDQLTVWSRLKAKLAVYFFLGPCNPVFVSEIEVDEPGLLTFWGAGSSLLVDIRKYDLMKVEVREQQTETTLLDRATGTILQISDAPMNHAQVLERFAKVEQTTKVPKWVC